MCCSSVLKLCQSGPRRFVQASLAHLGEADVLIQISEALAADVETVLADETGLVSADAAAVY